MKQGTAGDGWGQREREGGDRDEMRNRARWLGKKERWIKQRREEQRGGLADRQMKMKMRGTKKERGSGRERENMSGWNQSTNGGSTQRLQIHVCIKGGQRIRQNKNESLDRGPRRERGAIRITR